MAKKTNTLPVGKAKPIPVKIVNDSPKSSPVEYDDSKWRAEDALRTIQRAEELKSDKKLMSNVKKLASEQVKNLKKFC